MLWFRTRRVGRTRAVHFPGSNAPEPRRVDDGAHSWFSGPVQGARKRGERRGSGHSPGSHHELGNPRRARSVRDPVFCRVWNHSTKPCAAVSPRYRIVLRDRGDTCVPCSPRRPQVRGLAARAAGTARGPGNPLTGTTRSRRVDDLAVVVGTACRARGVGQLGVTAARAGDQHRARRLPLGTALAGVAPRHLPLRDGHFNPPGSPPRSREVAYLVTPRAVAGNACSARRGRPGAAVR